LAHLVQGAKPEFAAKYNQQFAVDTNDEVRNSIGIKKDFFGALGGRETYVRPQHLRSII
jgi:hypothetical protein